ncbi:MAG TPA: Nramp family divalent metal transporter [Geomonas sp.]|nr:Nramp family divalent metal transporter [Geomonas sp.]
MKINKKNILLFFSVLGPGIITANVDNDAGGIATYSVAGASFGYALLWTLIPITVALIVVQEMCARMGAVSGKTLADMIREGFGVKVTAYLMFFLLLANLGNTVAEFAGWAAAMEIFGVSKYISVPIGGFVVWWLIVKGSYKMVEKVFLFACTIYLTYIVSAYLAHPPWGEIMTATVTPSFELKPSYLMLVIGVVGTTIAPWMQFYMQSAVVEKGVRVEDYKACRLDVIFGCIMTDVVAFFIIVACGATMFVHGVHINDAKDAAMSLAPLAGKYASGLFAIGLANASLFAASILPLSTAYCVCEAMGWESGVDHDFESAPQFMWLYTGLIVLGGLIILFPNAPLIAIMLISQVVNGALLPFVLIFMLILINKKELMGEYTNSKSFNIIAWFTVVIMIVLTLALVVQTIVQ